MEVVAGRVEEEDVMAVVVDGVVVANAEEVVLAVVNGRDDVLAASAVVARAEDGAATVTHRLVVPHWPSPLKHCPGNRRDASHGTQTPQPEETRLKRSLPVQSEAFRHWMQTVEAASL